jgi:hypothetical protein
MMPDRAKDEQRPCRTANAALGWYTGLVAISAFVLMVGMLAAAIGQSEPEGAVRAERPIGFDIPVQPLSKALYAFSAATGIEILVDARYAAGRQSTAVKGLMAPRDALEILLAGSDLIAQEFGPGTVTLKTATLASSGRLPGAASSGDLPYFADIQRAVQRALCNDARTSPGHYRLALKLWIGRLGTVLRSQRLDTTGDQNLDAALDTAVQAIRIGRPAPPDLPQPVTLVVSQEAPDSTKCPSGAPDSRRAPNRQQ